ncbi:cell division protein ZapA [Hyphomonas sp. WL0036]|uniref:cell division protein ZapA n=1 Tax=Hyphomonas sediminis TaxID=2866160 RepID=UPI001C7E95E1|nr:cell division protein ZapA [Hyphomonas sediminis]MBY9065815.1 cell division protein ZapA [Hyphomonas sediminis]
MAKADIHIRGRSYSIACAPGQEVRVKRLAEQLDARLTSISSAVGDIGDDRLLLIAALALLDELDASRQSDVPSAAERRAALLVGAMAAKVEALAARLENGGSV